MRLVRVRALIEHEGRVLFVQHPHHPEGVWALPGGRVEDGEQLQDAMTRELVEELGISPVIGKIQYIHQLFLANGDESLEFFFEILNGADYMHIDLKATSHGMKEIRAVEFIDPAQYTILPEFLANYQADRASNIWPKLEIRHASGI